MKVSSRTRLLSKPDTHIKLTTISCVTILLLLLSIIPSKAMEISPALRVLLKIEKKFQEIDSISGNFQKTITMTNESVEISGELHYKKPDKIRIIHSDPVAQDLRSDGKRLYFKSEKEDINKELSSLSAEERDTYSMVPGFGIDLLAPIKVELYDFKTIEDELNTIKIVAIHKKNNVTAIEFGVDKKKNAVTFIKYRSYVGKEIYTTQIDFTDFKEIEKDNWFAMKVTVTAKDAFTQEETMYNNMKFNIELEDSLFVM